MLRHYRTLLQPGKRLRVRTLTVQYDMDSGTAAMQRKIVFADAAEKRYWVAGAHLSFPGVGHLRTAGSGYVFVPVNYGAKP
jgi:hypothetical protein